MDFSGLVKAVQEFWNFIWPPIVYLAVLWGVLAFLAPVALNSGWNRLQDLKPAPGTQIALLKAIKRFGFDKLVPVLAAFCLLFVFDGVRNMVVQVGQLIPPNIVYDQERLVLAHADSTDIRTLWYRMGSPDNIAEFSGRIERTVSDAKETHKNSPILGSIESWQEKSASRHVVFSACKFFIVFSIMAGGVEIWKARRYARTVCRLGVALLFFLCVAILFSLRFVWSVEQTFFSTTRAAQLFVPGTTPTCEFGKDGCKDYYQFIESARNIRHAPDRWWTISGTDLYYLSWLKQQAIHELE